VAWLLCLLPLVANAADNPAAAGAAERPLILAAAPRESEAAARALYDPLADYLSRQLGRPVVFRYPGSWGIYRTSMLKGEYDLVFDGPHLNSYRVEKLQHEVLVKLPGTFQFAIITREDMLFRGVSRMYGRSFCALPPPNLGTLVLFDVFDNPLRQPIVKAATSWKHIYEGVVTGKCDGGVLPLAQLKRFETTNRTKVLFYSNELPNQALSAGPRVTGDMKRRIRNALLSPAAAGPTKALRAESDHVSGFAEVQPGDYDGLSFYLQYEWGFY
jgi:ABC-type phosphate/phosphonate transport system substrate-binding protein